MDIFVDHSKGANSKPGFASILISFSLVRNTAILFGNKTHGAKQNASAPQLAPKKLATHIEHRFAYLHGVRAILVLWILAAHACSLIPASIIMPIAFLSRHPHDMVQMAKNNGLFGNFFNNGTLAVEAFFLIR